MPEIIVKLGDNIVQKYFFFQEPLSIGRSADNEIVIENLAISRNHAQVRFEGGRYFVTDLDSSNGTYVNGVRVKKTEIMDKDVISIGKHKIYFYDQKAPDPVRQPSMQDNDSTMLVDSKPEPELEAALVINKGRQKGQRFVLVNGITSLGRGSDNDVRLTDWFVSKQHAQIERRDKKFVIRDLGSWRHTFVNGEAIQEVPIRQGDVLQLGPTVELLFELGAPSSAPGRPAPRTPQELAAEPRAQEPQVNTQTPAPGQVPSWAAQEQVVGDSTGDPFTTSNHSLEQAQEASATELPYQEEQAHDQSVEMANGATGVLPIDAIDLSNPFDELMAEREAPSEQEIAAENQALNEGAEDEGQPDWMNTGKLLADVFAPLDGASEQAPEYAPESSMDAAPAAEATGEIPPLAEPEAPADTTGEPLVLAFADPRDDHADAVCEDMAEASLLAAAGAAGAANGSASASGSHAPVEAKEAEPAPAKAGRGKKKRNAQPEAVAEARKPAAAPIATQPAPAAPQMSDEQRQEVALWERALANTSQVIRKQAARRLKQLTGKDYDY